MADSLQASRVGTRVTSAPVSSARPLATGAPTLAQPSDKLESAARLASERVLRAPPPLSPLPPPMAGHVTRDRAYKSNAVLLVDGPAPDDVSAGSIEDCYLIATLSSIAAARPEMIDDIVRDNGNRTFTARFYDLDTAEPVARTVDNRVHVDAKTRRVLYASSANTLWGPVIEKAYAALYGSYDRIGRRGATAFVMSELTGHRTRSMRPDTHGASVVFDAMLAAKRERRPMVAETSGATLRGCDVPTRGIVSDHSYAVLDVSESNGERWVTLREPTGAREYRGDGYDTAATIRPGDKARRNDGVFRVRYNDFTRLFVSVVIMQNELMKPTGAAASMPLRSHIERIGAQAKPPPPVCVIPP